MKHIRKVKYLERADNARNQGIENGRGTHRYRNAKQFLQTVRPFQICRFVQGFRDIFKLRQPQNHTAADPKQPYQDKRLKCRFIDFKEGIIRQTYRLENEVQIPDFRGGNGTPQRPVYNGGDNHGRVAKYARELNPFDFSIEQKRQREGKHHRYGNRNNRIF